MEQELRMLLKSLLGFSSQQMEDVGILGFIFVMAVSLLCGVLIARLYRHFYSGRSTGSQIHRAFPLLSISVTSIFVTIQFSLPLSLGLLGALSIVRFRTPIKEPEEIGFLMLVIAASISCATFNFMFLGIVLLTAIVGLIVLRLRWLNQPQDECLVVVTLPSDQYEGKFPQLIEHLGANTQGGKVDSITRTGGSSVVAYSFRNLRNKTLQELESGLDHLVGESAYDMYFNHHRVA